MIFDKTIGFLSKKVSLFDKSRCFDKIRKKTTKKAVNFHRFLFVEISLC